MSMSDNIVYLTIKKKWFDEILSGRKNRGIQGNKKILY